MGKHRTFNADRYLDKLQGSESILRSFLELWRDAIDIDISSLSIPKFKKWLVESECEVKDAIVEELHRVYDLCTDWGQEDIFAAGGEFDYYPDPDQKLPVECLALKVRAEHEEAFNFAYDRYSLWRAERFSVYRGKVPRSIGDMTVKAKKFREQLAAAFKNHKNSDRVHVRHYAEGATTNFIVYHEKRVKAPLVFKSKNKSLKVIPLILRPAQQDFVSYNCATGQIEIESSYENEEATLRRTFAACLLDDADFFDEAGADECLALGVIASSQFKLTCAGPISAKLVELHFGLDQDGEPSFQLRAKDVLRTLEVNGLRTKLVGDRIKRAVFKIWFGDGKRGIRVEVYGKNRIKFNRCKHFEDVIALLTEWGILLDAEDVAELHVEPFGATGITDLAAS